MALGGSGAWGAGVRGLGFVGVHLKSQLESAGSQGPWEPAGTGVTWEPGALGVPWAGMCLGLRGKSAHSVSPLHEEGVSLHWAAWVWGRCDRVV